MQSLPTSFPDILDLKHVVLPVSFPDILDLTYVVLPASFPDLLDHPPFIALALNVT